MREAERHLMGWICSQFRIAGYVFAEVKARPQNARGKRWYFETVSGRSEERYWSQAEAYKAAEEAVLDLITQRAWGLDFPGMHMGYVSDRPKRHRDS
jgi:hypothetical protein